jgi:hypothetical protein
MAEIVEQVGGRLERRAARGVDRHECRRVRRDGDSQPARLEVDLLDERVFRRGREVCVAGLVAGHDVEQRRSVAHRARDRPGGAEAERARHPRSRGNAPARGLDAEEAAAQDGIRIEPPPSLPWASGARPAATAAAAPPLEPPGVRDLSHGLRQSPFSSDSVIAIVPNSGVFVLPITTNPASRMRRTTLVSKSGTYSANALHE